MSTPYSSRRKSFITEKTPSTLPAELDDEPSSPPNRQQHQNHNNDSGSPRSRSQSINKATSFVFGSPSSSLNQHHHHTSSVSFFEPTPPPTSHPLRETSSIRRQPKRQSTVTIDIDLDEDKEPTSVFAPSSTKSTRSASSASSLTSPKSRSSRRATVVLEEGELNEVVSSSSSGGNTGGQHQNDNTTSVTTSRRTSSESVKIRRQPKRQSTVEIEAVEEMMEAADSSAPIPVILTTPSSHRPAAAPPQLSASTVTGSGNKNSTSSPRSRANTLLNTSTGSNSNSATAALAGSLSGAKVEAALFLDDDSKKNNNFNTHLNTSATSSGASGARMKRQPSIASASAAQFIEASSPLQINKVVDNKKKTNNGKYDDDDEEEEEESDDEEPTEFDAGAGSLTSRLFANLFQWQQGKNKKKSGDNDDDDEDEEDELSGSITGSRKKKKKKIVRKGGYEVEELFDAEDFLDAADELAARQQDTGMTAMMDSGGLDADARLEAIRKRKEFLFGKRKKIYTQYPEMYIDDHTRNNDDYNVIPLNPDRVRKPLYTAQTWGENAKTDGGKIKNLPHNKERSSIQTLSARKPTTEANNSNMTHGGRPSSSSFRRGNSFAKNSRTGSFRRTPQSQQQPQQQNEKPKVVPSSMPEIKNLNHRGSDHLGRITDDVLKMIIGGGTLKVAISKK